MTFLQKIQRSPHFGFDGFGMAERALQKEYEGRPPNRMASVHAYDAEGAGSSGHSAESGRQAVMTLLRTQGAALRSSMLMSLAAQIAKDPFAKVKKLIQELIERMLQEASNEANQKGWCDKSIGDAEQKRDYTNDKIKDLNN